jgi:hypothetical protein
MVVSLFLMPREFLLTSHCVGSFQRPTVPSAGWLLDASAHVFYITVEQPRSISLHPKSQTRHTFVPKKLFSHLIIDSLSWNATGNWPKYLQRPFGHSAMYSPMWSPEPLSRILASVKGGSWFVVHRSGHKQSGPWNLCRARYSSHISGVTHLLLSTGLPSSFNFKLAQ